MLAFYNDIPRVACMSRIATSAIRCFLMEESDPHC